MKRILVLLLAALAVCAAWPLAAAGAGEQPPGNVATGKTAEWAGEGIAGVEVCVSGQPRAAGVDYLVLVDTCAAMGWDERSGQACVTPEAPCLNPAHDETYTFTKSVAYYYRQGASGRFAADRAEITVSLRLHAGRVAACTGIEGFADAGYYSAAASGASMWRSWTADNASAFLKKEFAGTAAEQDPRVAFPADYASGAPVPAGAGCVNRMDRARDALRAVVDGVAPAGSANRVQVIAGGTAQALFSGGFAGGEALADIHTSIGALAAQGETNPEALLQKAAQVIESRAAGEQNPVAILVLADVFSADDLENLRKVAEYGVHAVRFDVLETKGDLPFDGCYTDMDAFLQAVCSLGGEAAPAVREAVLTERLCAAREGQQAQAWELILPGDEQYAAYPITLWEGEGAGKTLAAADFEDGGAFALREGELEWSLGDIPAAGVRLRYHLRSRAEMPPGGYEVGGGSVLRYKNPQGGGCALLLQAPVLQVEAPALYPLAYDANGGDAASVPPGADVQAGTNVVLATAPAPARSDPAGLYRYTFDGWSTLPGEDNQSGRLTQARLPHGDGGGLTVYAIWVKTRICAGVTVNYYRENVPLGSFTVNNAPVGTTLAALLSENAVPTGYAAASEACGGLWEELGPLYEAQGTPAGNVAESTVSAAGDTALDIIFRKKRAGVRIEYYKGAADRDGYLGGYGIDGVEAGIPAGEAGAKKEYAGAKAAVDAQAQSPVEKMGDVSGNYAQTAVLLDPEQTVDPCGGTVIRMLFARRTSSVTVNYYQGGPGGVWLGGYTIPAAPVGEKAAALGIPAHARQAAAVCGGWAGLSEFYAEAGAPDAESSLETVVFEGSNVVNMVFPAKRLYSLVFEAGGDGVEGLPPPQRWYAGKRLSAEGGMGVSRPGYIFAGWAMSARDAEACGYAPESGCCGFAMPAGDVTLTALWRQDGKTLPPGDGDAQESKPPPEKITVATSAGNPAAHMQNGQKVPAPQEAPPAAPAQTAPGKAAETLAEQPGQADTKTVLPKPPPLTGAEEPATPGAALQDGAVTQAAQKEKSRLPVAFAALALAAGAAVAAARLYRKRRKG